MVFLLAFFAGSMVVRNSDFWLHLATGRLLAQGQYRFGVDPFSYTTAGVYWANHSWLFDWLLFQGYQFFGETTLVVLRGLTMVALAGLLLTFRRAETPFTISAICTVLGLLTISPQVHLRPELSSIVLCGVMLWFLWRLQRHAGKRALQLGIVIGLCALWVNLDRWFLLGPLLVALFWLGERLGGSRGVPGWLVVACAVACLASPHHVHALTLPVELSPWWWSNPLASDDRFRATFASPWQLRWYLQPTNGLSVTGLSYFVILLVSLASFFLSAENRRDWRLPVWFGFALLGAVSLRTVPFFAVVTVPIASLNLGDWWGTRSVATSWRTRLGSALLQGGLLALIVCAWPGWLHARPHEARRVRWEIRPDPSLVRLSTGKLGDNEGGHSFALHPDVGDYLAWSNPAEKSFLDHRLPIFRPVIETYLRASREIESGTLAEDLGAYRVRRVILYDSEPTRMFPTLAKLLASDRWQLEEVAGRAVVFGSGTTPENRVKGIARLAYSSRVPGAGPERLGEKTWWRRALIPGRGRSAESDAATMYLHLFEATATQQKQQATAAHLPSYAAGLAGQQALCLPPGVLGANLLLRVEQPLLFMPQIEERAPEFLLLMIQSARRALAFNPDDANAWLRLGQAYLSLRMLTGEPARNGFSPLDMLRDVQIATALEQAAALAPEVQLPHRILARLYGERQFLDAALPHQQAVASLVRKAGPLPREEADAFAQRIEREQQAADKLDELVQTRRNEFAIRSSALAGSPLAQAQLALSLGLVQHALDSVLLRSDVVLIGGNGARLQLELLVQLGRIEEARALLETPNVQEYAFKLGLIELATPLREGYAPRHLRYSVPAYEWLSMIVGAASGNYDEAERSLQRLLERQSKDRTESANQLRRGLSLSITSEIGLAAATPVFPYLILRAERDRLIRFYDELEFIRLQLIDVQALAGMLALERGQGKEALARFRHCLEQGRQSGLLSATAPLALRYIPRIEPHTKEGKRREQQSP
jgi:tetratricopeptide (TPR) repeat protein